MSGSVTQLSLSANAASCLQFRRLSESCRSMQGHASHASRNIYCCRVQASCQSLQMAVGHKHMFFMLPGNSLSQLETADYQTCAFSAKCEEEEEEFYKLRPANKTDHLCQSWQ